MKLWICVYVYSNRDGIGIFIIEQFHSEEDSRNSIYIYIVRVKLYDANKETAISINFSFSNAQ